PHAAPEGPGPGNPAGAPARPAHGALPGRAGKTAGRSLGNPPPAAPPLAAAAPGPRGRPARLAARLNLVFPGRLPMLGNSYRWGVPAMSNYNQISNPNAPSEEQLSDLLSEVRQAVRQLISRVDKQLRASLYAAFEDSRKRRVQRPQPKS